MGNPANKTHPIAHSILPSCTNVYNIPLSRIWVRSLKFYHLLFSKGKLENEGVFMSSAKTREARKDCNMFLVSVSHLEEVKF